MMQSIAVWEDEDHNRRVSLRVDYSVGPTGISIQKVTPEQVYFPSQHRLIRVRTEKGRAMVGEQFAAYPRRDIVLAQLDSGLMATAK